MSLLTVLAVLILSYILGSIPWGLIIVKIATGRDVRQVASGRTGGTNAFRAAGTAAGLLTAIFDVLKAAATALLVREFAPGNAWLLVGAALMAIVGHNYSLFIIERNEQGKLRFRGGAGGAATLGGAIALWPLSAAIILPLAILTYLFIGYASVTTMSIAFFATVLFAVRAYLGLSPWQYVLYGVVALALVIYALRPNIQALRNGTERMVGLRAAVRKRKQAMHEQNPAVKAGQNSKE